MKKIFGMFLIPAMVLAFSGFTFGWEEPGIEQLERDKQGDLGWEAPQGNKALPVGEYDAIIAQNENNTDENDQHCTPAFEAWCQEVCGDASPSKPSGSDRWGKKCTPGKLKQCTGCGFLPY